jgi:hypothetical protein
MTQFYVAVQDQGSLLELRMPADVKLAALSNRFEFEVAGKFAVERKAVDMKT